MVSIDTSNFLKSATVAEPGISTVRPAQDFQDVLIEEKGRLQSPAQTAGTARDASPVQAQQAAEETERRQEGPSSAPSTMGRSEVGDGTVSRNTPVKANPKKQELREPQQEPVVFIGAGIETFVRVEQGIRQDLPARDESAGLPAAIVQQLPFDANDSNVQVLNSPGVVTPVGDPGGDEGIQIAATEPLGLAPAISPVAVKTALLGQPTELTPASDAVPQDPSPTVPASLVAAAPEFHGDADAAPQENALTWVTGPGLGVDEEPSPDFEASVTAPAHEHSLVEALPAAGETAQPKKVAAPAIPAKEVQNRMVEPHERKTSASSIQSSLAKSGLPIKQQVENEGGSETLADLSQNYRASQVSSGSGPRAVEPIHKEQESGAAYIMIGAAERRSAPDFFGGLPSSQGDFLKQHASAHPQSRVGNIGVEGAPNEFEFAAGLEEWQHSTMADTPSSFPRHDLATPVEKMIIPPTVERPTTIHNSSYQWHQVEKASVVAQLVERAHLLVGKNRSELTIVLKPEFLGRVNLHASLVENSLMATIAAESPEVKQLLESQLSSLQTALREQGLPVVKVEVVQGNQLSFSEFGHGQGNSQNQETRQTQGLPPRDLPQNSHMQGETPVEAPSPLTSTPSRLLHLVA